MTRLDGKCNAKVLCQNDKEVMLTASWPASQFDKNRFRVTDGIAYNTVVVSREYFERKYGS